MSLLVVLTDDSDLLVVPSNPVIQMAYALALDERGDTGGSAGGSQFQLAETYIANATMDDVRKRPNAERTASPSGTVPA